MTYLANMRGENWANDLFSIFKIYHVLTLNLLNLYGFDFFVTLKSKPSIFKLTVNPLDRCWVMIFLHCNNFILYIFHHLVLIQKNNYGHGFKQYMRFPKTIDSREPT